VNKGTCKPQNETEVKRNKRQKNETRPKELIIYNLFFSRMKLRANHVVNFLLSPNTAEFYGRTEENNSQEKFEDEK
jgi:hypothetical protein